jgi:hypothetical protein
MATAALTRLALLKGKIWFHNARRPVRVRQGPTQSSLRKRSQEAVLTDYAKRISYAQFYGDPLWIGTSRAAGG